MTAPCDADPVILALEKDEAWELYEAAAKLNESLRAVEKSLRRQVRRQEPIMQAFENIRRLVPREESNAHMNAVRAAVTDALRQVEEITKRQTGER